MSKDLPNSPATNTGPSADFHPYQHPTSINAPRKELSERERLQWLRLIRSENVGPATFHDLVGYFGSAEKAIDALPELSRRGGAKKPVSIASLGDTEAEWNQIYRAGARLVAVGEEDYPSELAHIHAPPPLLTIVGDAGWAQKTSVSIVGSRNSSASGIKLTEMIARDLGQNGVVITSGLARGIDTAAHKAALPTGTIAVVAGGLNRLYPKENIELAHAVARQGLLISEMPWNWQPRGKDFPRRNRIISGISAATLVMEAALRSGSLITARYALEQGRDVFAIPGSPLDPRAGGTNQLIKQGAGLVCEAGDILSSLEHRLPNHPIEPTLFREMPDHSIEFAHDAEMPEVARNRFIQSLGPVPIAIDELIRQSNLDPGQAQVLLLELDLAGRLERHGNQTVSLKP